MSKFKTKIETQIYQIVEDDLGIFNVLNTMTMSWEMSYLTVWKALDYVFNQEKLIEEIVL